MGEEKKRKGLPESTTPEAALNMRKKKKDRQEEPVFLFLVFQSSLSRSSRGSPTFRDWIQPYLVLGPSRATSFDLAHIDPIHGISLTLASTVHRIYTNTNLTIKMPHVATPNQPVCYYFRQGFTFVGRTRLCIVLSQQIFGDEFKREKEEEKTRNKVGVAGIVLFSLFFFGGGGLC